MDRRRHATRRAVLALTHPVALTALAAMLINDLLLRRVLPDVITGKLSDVAAMVVVPLAGAVVLSPIAPRVAFPTSAIAVSGWFTATKLSPSIAHLTGEVLSGLVGWDVTIVADRTDLVALPFLALTVVAWRSDRLHSARPARAIVVLVAAFALVADTPCPSIGFTSLTVADGAVLANHGDGWPEQSEDGGRTWSNAYDIPEHAEDAGDLAGTCVDAVRCFRAGQQQGSVEMSEDRGESWTTIWAYGPGRIEYLQSIQRARCRPDDIQLRDFAAVDGALVAAMGGDGVHRWDQTTGWVRGVTGDVPPLRGVDTDAFELQLTASALTSLVILAFAAGAARRRIVRTRQVGRWRRLLSYSAAFVVVLVAAPFALAGWAALLYLVVGGAFLRAWSAWASWLESGDPARPTQLRARRLVVGGAALGTVSTVLTGIAWTAGLIGTPWLVGPASVFGHVVGLILIVVGVRTAQPTSGAPRSLGTLPSVAD